MQNYHKLCIIFSAADIKTPKLSQNVRETLTSSEEISTLEGPLCPSE